MSSRYPYRKPTPYPVPSVNQQLPFSDPGQEIPYSPQELDARENVVNSQARLQDAVSQQEIAQKPSGLEGIIQSPIFQLAVPTLLTTLAAIRPRAAGAAGIGLAGLRGATDVVGQQQQQRRATAADQTKQRIQDFDKQKLKYSVGHNLEIAGVDPTEIGTFESAVDLDPSNAAQYGITLASKAAAQKRFESQVAELRGRKMGPGQSGTAQGPYGSETIRGPEPTPRVVQPANTDIEVILGDFRKTYGREPTTREMLDLKRQLAQAGHISDKVPGELSAGQLRNIQQTARQFSQEDVVKQTQEMARNVDFVRSVGANSTDDIGRIYAFAKSMDPNSVVRESEYATVQQYAQAQMEALGFRLRRVVDNSGFLTREAREFMAKTLATKYASGLKQYKNVYSAYANKIQAMGGDPKTDLIDYGAVFPEIEAQAGGQAGGAEGGVDLSQYKSGAEIAAAIATGKVKKDENTAKYIADQKAKNPKW